MDSKEDVANENNELKVLILKLNQDKTMYEKKVQRRNQEISRLKQMLQEKDDQLSRMGTTPQLSKSFVELPSSSQRTRLETLENLIVQNKELVDVKSSLSPEGILQKIIDKLVSNEQDKAIPHQPRKVQSLGKLDPEPSDDKIKQLEREITKLQDQIRLDTNYSNKRIHQLEEGFFRQKKELQTQIQNQCYTIQLQNAKLAQLLQKLAVYERNLQDINQCFVDNELVKQQVLLQYQKLQTKYRQYKKTMESQKKDSSETKTQTSQAEDRVKTLGSPTLKKEDVPSAAEIDMIIQNIQKNTSSRIQRKQ